MIDIAQIRIEALKLAHRSDLKTVDVIDRASAYEQYIIGSGQTEKPDNRPKRPGRQTGKTDEQ